MHFIAFLCLAAGFIVQHLVDPGGWQFAASGAVLCFTILLQGVKRKKENNQDEEH